jgi:hypothetical protein
MPVAAAGLLLTALAIPAPAMPATSAVDAVSTEPHPATAPEQANRTNNRDNIVSNRNGCPPRRSNHRIVVKETDATSFR